MVDQVCFVHMILEEFDQATTELLPLMIAMESDTELTMYTIVNWQLIHVDQGEFTFGPP